MKRANMRLILALTVCAIASVALAQETANAGEGLTFAQTVCAECHAVRDGERASLNAQAPSFTSVANARGMNEIALRVWFQSPHPTMPSEIDQSRG
jgi:mono/diheme cytochrome c family protein